MNNDLKYDAFGNLDADYYVEKAYELRRQYYAQLTKKAVAGVKTFYAKLTANRSMKSAQPQH